jgi:hypothetical protein
MTAGQQTEQLEKLQKRIVVLEQHVTTLSVALDTASRLRLSTADTHPEVRIVGGRTVRRLLERGGLVHGYPELPSVA